MLPEVLPLRRASRELVRELGFLEGVNAAADLPHSHCHALIEVEAAGALKQADLPGLLRVDKSTSSRIVADLEMRGWVRTSKSSEDARARLLSLTPRGKKRVARVHDDANARVEGALASLSNDNRNIVLRGMLLYAQALERTRRAASLHIRSIEPRDNAAVARLVRTVMPEFGAKGPGFAILDPEVDDMHAAYSGSRTGYFVVEDVSEAKPRIVGGGGFAPLEGASAKTCELRKMYFLPDVRGLGVGRTLLEKCIAGARAAKFRQMYLETLTNMSAARSLYEKNGFVRLPERLGSTGHFGCDIFYSRKL